VILVLASELDQVAREAVATWPGGQAMLLTPADFLSKGWRTYVGGVRDWTIVANGRALPANRVSGVITLLTHIPESELFDIEPNDRRYVAAEANAFALFVLAQLPCPVVNRPSPGCLCGPNWRPEQWAQACFKSGIRTDREIRRSANPAHVETTPCAFRSVSVMGGHVIGDASHSEQAGLRALTRLANIDYLQVHFRADGDGWVFHHVQAIPDLSSTEIRSGLESYFASPVLS
jgi:hypothetical protein